MKKIIAILVVIVGLFATLGMLACDRKSPTGGTHKHNYDSIYKYDQDVHWHVCSCGEVDGYYTHNFNGDTCSRCGYKKDENCSSGLRYELNEDKNSYYVIGDDHCTDVNVVIPSTYKEMPVTRIGQNAFYWNFGIKSVVIGDNVTRIEEAAFDGCGNLESVEIGDNVTYIGDYAFNFCKKLKSVRVPNNLTFLGGKAFDGCTSLQYYEYDNELYLGNESNKYQVLMKVNDIGISNFSFINTTKIIYGNAFSYSMITEIVIPNHITHIGTAAFSNCYYLESISIGNSVQYIGPSAFWHCRSLKNIIISDSVISIGDSAFSSCYALESIVIGSGVKAIGKSASSDCDNLSAVFFNGTKREWQNITIGYDNDNLNRAKLYYFSEYKPDTVGDYWHYVNGKPVIWGPASGNQGGSNRDYAHRDTEHIGLAIGENCPTCGLQCYDISHDAKNGGTSVLMHDIYSYELIAEYYGERAGNEFASYKNMISAIYISAAVKTIAPVAFDNHASVFSVYIAENSILETIGDNAFKNCTSMSDIDLSKCNLLTSIGISAFEGCTQLSGVTLSNSLRTISSMAFRNCKIEELEIKGNISNIGSYAFYDCSDLKRITIADSVTEIGENAFGNCPIEQATIPAFAVNHINAHNLNNRNLKTVVVTSGDTLKHYAFADCRNLVSVTLPDTVTTLEDYAFYNCSSLGSITIPGGVTSIGKYAFSDCNNLTKVNITDLSSWCAINFDGLSSNPLYCAGDLYLNDELITNLVIPSGVKSISDCAFYNCSILSADLDSDVENIGWAAFRYCINLQSVIIGNKVTTIEDQAFLCENLATVFYHGTEQDWYNISIGGLSNSLYHADRYYYSANEPTTTGRYWRYVNELPTIWEITYTLTYSADEGGHIDGNTSQTVKEGEDGQTVKAVANDGYAFVSWSDGVTTAERIDRNVVGNINVTAMFQLINQDTHHAKHLALEVDEVCPECGMECYDIKNGGKSILMYDRNSGKISAEYYGESAGSEFAAYRSKITEIYISADVKTIESRAFLGYSVVNVCFADGSKLETIGLEAFYSCYSLAEIELNKCSLLTSIGSNAFWDCSSLETIALPDNVISVGGYAFDDTKWYNNQPAGLVYLQYIAYKYKGSMPFDTKLNVKEGIRVIADSCFNGVGASLRSISLPASLQYIGYNAFYGCAAMRSIDLPDALIQIGDSAFYNYGLTGIEIPDNVISIGNYAFYGCDNLESVIIGKSVESIGSYAFQGCNNITSVIFKDTSGWSYSYYSDFSSAHEISSEDLSNPQTAARYLTQNSTNRYYWKKTV